MWTDDFARFVAPARARPALWRVGVAILVIVAVYFAWILAVLAAAWAASGGTALEDAMHRIADADTPASVLWMLATFLGMALGAILAARLLHGRRMGSLFGPGLWRGFAAGAVIAAGVFAATFLMPLPFDPVRNVPADVWLTLLPLALLGLLVQTGAEEVLFRGYLQTQLAARFDSPVAWMALPAVVFGALHYDPAGAGGNAPWLVAAATLFGLIAADLTRVTGSIGAAWGVHFVNNAFAILIVALDGALSGLSFWKTPFAVTDTAVLRPLIAFDMLTTVIVWAAIRLWLARRARPA